MKAHEKKMDLLDLPVAERKRLCLEIRAALRERVAIGQIPVADDVIVADKSMWNSPQKSLNEGQKASDLPQKSSLLNSLSKRVW
jgi:hypothetical protein